MMDPVRELKVRAELLHHAVAAGDAAALPRLRVLAELRKAPDETLREAAAGVQRKHCLGIVAREVGFVGWEHARQVLEGEDHDAGFGRLLCPPGRGTFLNHWCATYAEAKALHTGLLAAGERRYLLAFQTQYFLTERDYIASLGLDPEDEDWRALGWDWARPRSLAARRRLYAKLLTASRPA